MLLVTGGTGFVGSAVADELLSRGESVAVLSRDGSKVQQRFGDGMEAREGDVRYADQLAVAMKGIDTVIDCVQFPTSPIEIPRKGWTFEEIDYKGTLHQVDAAKAAGVRRYVYVSGVGAAEDAEKHWFRFKWLAEQYVAASGLAWTTIRPTWIYGPNDSSLNRLLGFSRFLPFVPLFGDGKQAMQPVFVNDVARVAVDAALSPAAEGKLIELGGPDVMTMNEVLRTALHVMKRRRFILHQPVFVGKLAGRLASLLPTPPLSADAVDFINAPAVADNTALEQTLQPKLTPLREGLETYLA